MVNKGDRIELIHTNDQYTSLTSGDRGTVKEINEIPTEVTDTQIPQTQIWINWDNESKLALIKGEDRFKIIKEE